MAERRSLEKTASIRATQEAVWKAVTEGDEIKRWFTLDAQTAPGLGGRVWLSWGGEMVAETKFTLWDPPQHMQMSYASQNGVELFVDYYVESEDGGTTKLRLVHSGFSVGAEWDGEYDSYERGWGIYVRNLRHMLERHPHTPCVHCAFTKMLQVGKPEAWDEMMKLFDRDGTLGTPREGDSFAITTRDGTRLEGKVEIFDPGRDFAAVLTSANDSLLRISFEGPKDSAFVFVALLAFGLPDQSLKNSLGELMK